MIEKKVIIGMAPGIEERPIAVLVQKASKYESSIYLVSDNKKVNAKSIMGMMGMALKTGESVTIAADGPDEEAAVMEIATYLGA